MTRYHTQVQTATHAFLFLCHSFQFEDAQTTSQHRHQMFQIHHVAQCANTMPLNQMPKSILQTFKHAKQFLENKQSLVNIIFMSVQCSHFINLPIVLIHVICSYVTSPVSICPLDARTKQNVHYAIYYNKCMILYRNYNQRSAEKRPHLHATKWIMFQPCLKKLLDNGIKSISVERIYYKCNRATESYDAIDHIATNYELGFIASVPNSSETADLLSAANKNEHSSLYNTLKYFQAIRNTSITANNQQIPTNPTVHIIEISNGIDNINGISHHYMYNYSKITETIQYNSIQDFRKINRIKVILTPSKTKDACYITIKNAENITMLNVFTIPLVSKNVNFYLASTACKCRNSRKTADGSGGSLFDVSFDG